MRTVESGWLSRWAPEISVRNAGSRFLSTRAARRPEQETHDPKHLMTVPLTPPLLGLLLPKQDKKNRWRRTSRRN